MATTPQSTLPFDDIALRWSNLADRRLAYYVSLYESGRWRRYFGEKQFLDRIRDVKRAAQDWDRLASRRVRSNAGVAL